MALMDDGYPQALFSFPPGLGALAKLPQGQIGAISNGWVPHTMPTTTISVSPAVPDKLVVNGVDLLNREELSVSQNRELQRYIDAHAHLLGFLDKDKEGANEAGDDKEKRHIFPPPASTPTTTKQQQQQQQYSPISSSGFVSSGDDYHSSPASGRGRKAMGGIDDDFASPPARPPSSSYGAAPPMMNAPRAGSPYSLSSEQGKRKGVSWSDRSVAHRARSNSPPPAPFQHHQPRGGRGGGPLPSVFEDAPRGYGGPPGADSYDEYYGQSRPAAMMNGHGQDYSRHRGANPFDHSDGWGSSNPWTGSLDHRGKGKHRPQGGGWSGFAKPDLPTYSALARKPDDFNPYQQHLHREEAIGLRKSQERDESIKFHAYGDHRVSGIEMKPKGWTGGELVTDPNIMNKSLKPRRFYYSPIGDGVVAADGIEMKRPPPDLTPRRYEYRQRYVEQAPGEPGVRVTEKVWHEGELGDDDRGTTFRTEIGPDAGRRPAGDGGFGKGPPPRWPEADDDDDGGPKGPRGIRDGGGGPRGPSSPPMWGHDDDDGGGPRGPGAKVPEAATKMPEAARPPFDDGARGRPISALSSGGGTPREGWQVEFITNPRELINQYGMETLTTIFDTEDHTPKTYTTLKETWSPAPPELLAAGGNGDEKTE